MARSSGCPAAIAPRSTRSTPHGPPARADTRRVRTAWPLRRPQPGRYCSGIPASFAEARIATRRRPFARAARSSDVRVPPSSNAAGASAFLAGCLVANWAYQRMRQASSPRAAGVRHRATSFWLPYAGRRGVPGKGDMPLDPAQLDAWLAVPPRNSRNARRCPSHCAWTARIFIGSSLPTFSARSRGRAMRGADLVDHAARPHGAVPAARRADQPGAYVELNRVRQHTT